jgi:thiol-disulfide isomerase/thioredoxin
MSTPHRDLNIRGSVITLVVLVLLGGVAWLVTQRDTVASGQQTLGGDVVEQFSIGERESVEDFEATLLSGKAFNTRELAGRVAVYNVWGSWCAPCRAEAPDLIRVADEYRDDVTFVGINVRDNPAAARAFERNFAVPYESIQTDDSSEALLAFGGALASAAVPSTVVVDRDGRIAARIVGQVNYGTLESLVAEVVAEAE